MRELAAIVIPVFAKGLSKLDFSLLQHAVGKLTEFSLVFVCADDFRDESLKEQFPGATVYRYDPAYFTDRNAFARLLMHEDLYDRFGWSENLFILQGESLIVKNELHYWCKQGHDYVSDKEGSCSLRNVDRFLSLVRRNKRGINNYLAAPYAGDHPYWEKKSGGIWPSLRAPTEIVSAYFSRPCGEISPGTSPDRLPFVITGFREENELFKSLVEF